jgi:hypothetical protein
LSHLNQIEEMRSSVRFPLQLPVEIKADDQSHQAETRDISAGGVLFQMDTPLKAGSAIEFRIAMPAEVLGTASDVKVHCVGRVVRTFSEEGRTSVAAVIDEYFFERP